MNARDALGVALRAMGVWLLVQSVFSVVETLFRLDGVPLGTGYTWQLDLLYCLGNGICGLVLLRGADAIVRFAYRETPPDDRAGGSDPHAVQLGHGHAPIRQRAMLGVASRAMGVWWLSVALYELITLAVKLGGVPLGSRYTWQYSLLSLAGNALGGLIMFLGADEIVRFAYRETPPDDEVERF